MIHFSVIIPNYNHSPFLKQRIESVLQQTCAGFELIILDDCSSDNSREVIEMYRDHPRISHIIYNENNSGSPFLQWKKGITLAKNEWIWIAESDDFADASFLERITHAISHFPAAGIFYSDSFIVEEPGGSIIGKFSERKNGVFGTSKWNSDYFANGPDEINEYLKFDCTINNISSVVFRKELFTTDSTLLDEFKYYGDWYFLLNAAFSTGIAYIASPLNYYRKHGSSHLNSDTSIITSRKEYFRILRLLYYHKMITGKKELLDHFAFHYLSFGLHKDGLRTGWQIIKSYFKTDAALARKAIRSMAAIKLFRQKRPFFVPENKERKIPGR